MSPTSIETILTSIDLPESACSIRFFAKHIKACGTFQGGAASDIEESATVLRRVLSITFRNIQRYGCRSPVQLIMNGKTLGDLLK